MRRRQTRDGLTVRAIAGTHVVMLGFTMDEADCDGLKGFAIHRTDHTEDEAYYLRGQKTFEATDPGFPLGSSFSTRDHPIQSFTWADYTAKPCHTYSYRVEALHGAPDALNIVASTRVRIDTEDLGDGHHDVHFNRGVAASQAYARRFGNRRPDEVGPAAFAWLSRGLFEALIAFIDETGPTDGLRVAAYEFHYAPVLDALSEARRRGVDVEIIYDAKGESPGETNREAVRDASLVQVSNARETHPSYIQHNKFIVRLTNDEPTAVLTGGTNFSDGGIFGHANNLHVVRDGDVAQSYLDYWNLMKLDLRNAEAKPRVEALASIPRRFPPRGTSAIFSPRSTTDALEFYARIASQANDSLFATFAFGMNPLIQEVYATSEAPLRYAILEKKTRPMARGPARDAAEGAIDDLRRMDENLFAIGSRLTSDRFDRWVAERDSGLNTHVKYIHNKFMLIDPTTSSPIVISGSANFSKASSVNNDENMLVVRGDRRVADIYLGEFTRLYRHHAFREYVENRRASRQAVSLKHLRTDNWWARYFGTGSKSRQRQFWAA